MKNAIILERKEYERKKSNEKYEKCDHPWIKNWTKKSMNEQNMDKKLKKYG